jgi:predicted signal transduction protein with EAL and GGDEF domain
MVTASLGVAAIPENGTDAQTLIAAADKAMYAAKAAGRNCVMRATAAPKLRVADRAGGRRATTARRVRVIRGADTVSS